MTATGCKPSKSLYEAATLKAEKGSIRLILASQSEFRKKAFKILGLTCDCIPANIDEKAIRHENPITMAKMLSEAKAYEIAKREEGIIVSGDAFLVLQGKILEKPTSLDEAYEMLKQVSGNMYTFVTGLAVYDTFTKKMRSEVVTCDIYFNDLTENDIRDYCSRYPVHKFAGAHETDAVVRFAKRIEGASLVETSISVPHLEMFLKEIFQERELI